MWIYFVVGILMFVVGFRVGVRWSVAKFKSAMDDLIVELEEESY